MAEDDAPTFAEAPPERIDLPGGLALVRCDPDRAASAAAAINASLDHLRPWMAWAQQPATEASIGAHFAVAAELWDRRKDFGFSIIEARTGAVVGGGGLHPRLGPEGLEIGYWVHVDHIGRGVATGAARALTDAAFGIDGIERVRITCAEDNVRSARVPEKLGFRFEGVQVPADGPCEGRPSQIWIVDRGAWPAADGPPTAAASDHVLGRSFAPRAR